MLVKHTVASTGRKEHKPEVFEALAQVLQSKTTCRRSEFWRAANMLAPIADIKILFFLVVMRVQCIQWSLGYM